MEQTTKSGVTTTTKYYAAGQVTLEDQGGTLSYLLSDGLSSVSIAMNTAGTITSDVHPNLYTPCDLKRKGENSKLNNREYCSSIVSMLHFQRRNITETLSCKGGKNETRTTKSSYQ